MANTYRKILADNHTVVLPCPASTAIEIGDLVYWDDSNNYVLPASSQTDQGSEDLNQLEFADKFIGVAEQQRLSTETTTGDNSRRVFSTQGVYEFPCPSTTWEIGDLIGASENGSGDGILDQQVEKVTDPSRAIGVCVERGTAAKTVVRCRLISKWAYDLAHHRTGGAGSDVLYLPDDGTLTFGTGEDAQMLWSDGDASNHTLVTALGDTNQALHITDKGAKATDWALSADTHPTVYIHSNTTPATDYLKIGAHDGTNAELDVVGGTTLLIKIAGTTMAQFGSTPATALTLGDASDTDGSVVTVFDGGAEKPGALLLYAAGGTGYYLWVDSSGDVRVHTSYPTDEDMDGTVVGTQT